MVVKTGNTHQDEGFDMTVEKEKLRLYYDHLKRKKGEEKAKKFSCETSSGSADRFLHLYEEGRQKLLHLRDEEKSLDVEKSHREVKVNDMSSDHICNRLYEDGLKKVTALREQEEARAKPPPPKQFVKKDHRDESHVCHRLYDESRRLQEIGREKREEVERIITQAHPKPPPSQKTQNVASRTLSNTKKTSSSSSSDVSARLYAQSSKMQKYGRDRREEIELARDSGHAKVLHLKQMNALQPKRAEGGHQILKESRDDDGLPQLFRVIRDFPSTRD